MDWHEIDIGPATAMNALHPDFYLEYPPVQAGHYWQKNFTHFLDADPVGAVAAGVTHFTKFSSSMVSGNPTAWNLRGAMGSAIMFELETRDINKHELSTPKLAAQMMFACDLDRASDRKLWHRGVDVLVDRFNHALEHNKHEVRVVVMDVLGGIAQRIRRRETQLARGLPRGRVIGQ